MRQDVEPFLHKCVGGEVCSELLVPRYEALGLQLKETLVAGCARESFGVGNLAHVGNPEVEIEKVEVEVRRWKWREDSYCWKGPEFEFSDIFLTAAMLSQHC
jgi:hypothetical protein